jgi:hypothetical protein
MMLPARSAGSARLNILDRCPHCFRAHLGEVLVRVARELVGSLSAAGDFRRLQGFPLAGRSGDRLTRGNEK